MSSNRHAVERWVGNDLQNVLAWTSRSLQWAGRSRMALLPGNCLVEEASHRARIGTCRQTCRWTRYIKIKGSSGRLLSHFCGGTKPEGRLCMSQAPLSMEKSRARKEQEGKTQFCVAKPRATCCAKLWKAGVPNTALSRRLLLDFGRPSCTCLRTSKRAW